MQPEFSRQGFEKYSNIKFHKIRPLGAELFHAGGRTDMTQLIVAFRNFANEPKNWHSGRRTPIPTTNPKDRQVYDPAPVPSFSCTQNEPSGWKHQTLRNFGACRPH